MRLSVWVSISFGIAIATSQTANAWKAINNIDNNVYFLNCSYQSTHPYPGICPKKSAYISYDGEMALGHTLSCGQDQTSCGAGHGQDIYVAVPLVGAVRLLYPYVHVPPHGVVSFSPGFYTASDDDLYPSIWPIPKPSPICQRWTTAGPILRVRHICSHMGRNRAISLRPGPRPPQGAITPSNRNPTTALGRQRGVVVVSYI